MHFIPLLTLPISLAPFAPIHQPGVKAPTPFARPRSSPGHQPTTRYQGSIKAKTPAIKANRASSRHIKARHEIINWAAGSRPPCGVRRHVSQFQSAVMPAHSTLLPPTAQKIPDPGRVNQGSIKAKNPVIVPHQGSSRHPLKINNAIMPSALHPRTAPLNSVGRRCPSAPFIYTVWPAPASGALCQPPGNFPSLHPPLRLRACAFALKPQQSCMIKAHRASSRQTKFFSLGSTAPSPARTPFPPPLDVGCSALVVGCFPIFRPRHPNSRPSGSKILFSSPVKYGHLWSHNDSSDSYN